MVIELWLGMRARDHLEKDRKELSGAMEIYTLIEVVAYLGAYICQNEYNCIPKIRAFHGFWVYNFTSILKKPQIKPSCRASDCQLRSTEGAPSSPNTLRSPSYFGMQIRPPLAFSVSKVNLAAPLCSRHLTCPPPPGGGFTGASISPGTHAAFLQMSSAELMAVLFSAAPRRNSEVGNAAQRCTWPLRSALDLITFK